MTALLKRILTFGVALTVCLGMAAADTKYTSGVKHFAWGTEVGGGIDLTSNDLSTVDIDSFCGYRNSWIDVLGVGAEINMMVANSNRAFPVYAIFRTNFSSRPSACFLDLRVGASFNNMGDDNRQTGLYLSPGVGFCLARGKAFQSYVALSYVFNDIRPYTDEGVHHSIHGLHMAAIRLGISF